MASDNTHHLEGAYLSTGTFRMYFYDEFTKPQKLAAVQKYKATLMVKDAKTGKDTPYSLVRSGATICRRRSASCRCRRRCTRCVKFAPDGKDNRFDFTFPAYSKEPHAAAGPTMTQRRRRGDAPRRCVETLPRRRPPPSPPGASSGIDPALVPLPIPDTVPEMLAQLQTRTEQIRAFIDKGIVRGDLRAGVPGQGSRARARRAQERADAGAAQGRRAGDRQTGASAYLLDAFGDIGNKQQISEAYAKFVEAAKDIHASFPQSAVRNPQ